MSRARADTVKVPPPGPIEVWITRDSLDGVPLASVDVWSVQPDRFTDDEGAFWVAMADEDRLARVEWASAVKRYRTLPDDDRQCIRCWIRGAR